MADKKDKNPESNESKPAEESSPPESPEVIHLRSQVIEVLKSCYDPEIPVNIYELGLIYKVDVEPLEKEAYKVAVDMTLTSPACPVAGSLPPEVEQKIAMIEEIAEAKVEVVWDPPWNQSMMSEAARLQLNMF